jgi:hypothetical protein
MKAIEPGKLWKFVRIPAPGISLQQKSKLLSIIGGSHK